MVKGLYTVSLSPEVAEKGKVMAGIQGKTFSGKIQELLESWLRESKPPELKQEE